MLLGAVLLTNLNKMTAYILNVDIGKIVVIASSISELDDKVKEAGIFHYEIDAVAEYFIT